VGVWGEAQRLFIFRTPDFDFVLQWWKEYAFFGWDQPETSGGDVSSQWRVD
jgi:hypothetical protein